MIEAADNANKNGCRVSALAQTTSLPIGESSVFLTLFSNRISLKDLMQGVFGQRMVMKDHECADI